MLFVAQPFEIINGTHPELEQFPETRNNGWNSHAKRKATSFFNPLSAKPTKWSNALKQFAGNSRQIV